jgi:hypothetical protein
VDSWWVDRRVICRLETRSRFVFRRSSEPASQRSVVPCEKLTTTNSGSFLPGLRRPPSNAQQQRPPWLCIRQLCESDRYTYYVTTKLCMRIFACGFVSPFDTTYTKCIFFSLFYYMYKNNGSDDPASSNSRMSTTKQKHKKELGIFHPDIQTRPTETRAHGAGACPALLPLLPRGQGTWSPES